MAIHVLYGPQGSGKTTIAAQLQKALGAKRIVDDWEGCQKLKDGDLAITVLQPGQFMRHAPAGVKTISVNVARGMVKGAKP